VAPDELTIIDRYFRPLAGEGGLGLLDDAANLRVPPGLDLVLTKDMIASGVHFLADDPPETIARKALRVNLSDLAAKGASPIGYLLGVCFASDLEERWIAAFARGLRIDQELFGIELLGGDTISAPAGPVISITAFGTVPTGRMVHRSGGRPGDLLFVSGTIGDGAAGLALLRRKTGPWDGLGADQRDRLVSRYRVPEPRLRLAPALLEYASAAMDISDGLVGDCDKLAWASGCSATIEAERVPLPFPLGADDTQLATLLTVGDDYEILAAIPPRSEPGFREAAAEAGVPVTRIGALTKERGPTEVRFRGRPLPLHRRAYVHGPGVQSS